MKAATNYYQVLFSLSTSTGDGRGFSVLIREAKYENLKRKKQTRIVKGRVWDNGYSNIPGSINWYHLSEATCHLY